MAVRYDDSAEGKRVPTITPGVTGGTDTEPSPPKPLCVACRSQIEPGATICPMCKSWQKRWKNGLTYYGSLVAASALIVTGLSYAVPSLYRWFHHVEDVEVVDFLYPGNFSYSNPGTEDIFLSHIAMRWHDSGFDVVVGKKLTHGEFYFSELSDSEKNLFGEKHTHPWIFNDSGDGTPLLSRADIVPGRAKCFGIIVMTRDLYIIDEMNQIDQGQHQKLATADAELILSYYSLTSTIPRTKIIPSVIQFVDFKRPDPSCRLPPSLTTFTENPSR